jgi:hypothetical protein
VCGVCAIEVFRSGCCYPLLVVVTTVKKETWWLAEPINLLPGEINFVW